MAYKRISPVPVNEGGSGALTFTAHGVLLGEGTSAFGVTAVGTTGQVLTGVTGADPVWAAPAASSISITGNSGGALTGNSFTFTGGTTGLTFSGAGSTETLTGTLVVANGGTGATTLTGVLIGNGTSAVTANAVTQYNVLVGGASNAITSIAPSATSGVPLISQGAVSNPAFGTAVVAGGGTGATTLTNHGVLLGQGTSAIVATAVGTTGQVLTGVTGADPVWASPAAAVTGSIIGGIITTNATGGIRYVALAGGSAQTTVGLAQYVAPMAGTIDKLYVNSVLNSNTATGTFTLNKNGSNTSLVASVTASTTGVFSDTNGAHAVTVAAGDLLAYEMSQATTGTTSAIITVRFTPS